MKNSRFKRIGFFVNLLVAQLSFAQTPISVKSPDETILVTLYLDEGKPFYNIKIGDKIFLEPSPLGLKTSLGNFTNELSSKSHNIKHINEKYDFKKGKSSHINYEANELIFELSKPNEDRLFITFRVSNNDVAFSYKVTTKERQTNIKIFEEATGFNLPKDAATFLTPQASPMTGWEKTKPSYEEIYRLNEGIQVPSEYGLGYTFPALFKLAGNSGWLLISETGVDSHYPGSRLGEPNKEGLYKLAFPQEGENNSIGETYSAQAMPAQTPWRTITLGKP